MVRTIVKRLFWALIILLVIVWLLTGGIDKVKAATKYFGNPLSSVMYGGGAVQLPWAVPIPQGADISNLVNGSNSGSQNSQAESFGNPSPYANQLGITAEGANAVDPQQEYLVIQNTGQSNIDISGWSVQSALTGARAYIPLAASFFRLGELNAQTGLE